MTTKKYTYIRIYKESAEALKQRLEKMNTQDLRKIGVRNGKIPQIEFTKFLFKNPIFISDGELKNMAKRKFGGRIC